MGNTIDRSRGEVEASGRLSGFSAQRSELLRSTISLAASWHLVRLFLEVQRARSTGYAANQKPGENSSAPALKNPNCCGRQYRSLRRGISSVYFSTYKKHDRRGTRRIGSQRENCPGPAHQNPNCCGRQYRSLRRGLSSVYFSTYKKHDRRGTRRIGSQRENCPGPALKNRNCCGRQYRSLRRGISSDYFSRSGNHV